MPDRTIKTVDDYVSTQVLPEQRDIVTRLRTLVRECTPEVEEVVSYGMPVFKHRGKIFAWILGTKKDITFSFRDGAYLQDRFKVLRGVGKHARHVKLKTAGDVDDAVLSYYIRQAVDRDST